MTRTRKIHLLSSTLICLLLLDGNSTVCAHENSQQPNVVMISIDDLNDWVGPLKGHPQVKTPAIDSLAKRGIVFRNAHCQSPLCNSSRTSVMTSLRPSTTGIYGLAPWFRDIEKYKRIVSLPQHFNNAGYETYTCGKVYHNSMGHKVRPGTEKEFSNWGPGGWPGVMPKEKLIPPTPAGNNPWVDWGVFPHDEQKKGDWIVADWAESKLKNMPQDKPFFMAVGFFLPHVPCHVTKKWWDMYPDESLVMPVLQPDDRQDCSPFSWYLHWKLPEPRLAWLRTHNQHRNLVRSYLASVSFVDSQVQRVLDALDSSPHASNTIIVLWSDHGYHLGEKQMTGKTTLWERSTRVPLIFAGPGITESSTCDQPVELLDIYPTLSELAELDSPDRIEGISLMPQIRDPNSKRMHPAITTHNPGNYGIRGERFRLIRYADGSEEFYDLKNDPHEHHNIVEKQEFEKDIRRLRASVPEKQSPLAPGSKSRILEKRVDGWYWEGELIDPDNPPCFDK